MLDNVVSSLLLSWTCIVFILIFGLQIYGRQVSPTIIKWILVSSSYSYVLKSLRITDFCRAKSGPSFTWFAKYSTKQGIIRNLYNRAETICNNEESLRTEIDSLTKDLQENGYSVKLINETKDKHRQNLQQNKRNGSITTTIFDNTIHQKCLGENKTYCFNI